MQRRIKVADKAAVDELIQKVNGLSGTATSSKSGLMSPEDKAKLDGIETGAQKNVAVTLQSLGAAAAYHNHDGTYAKKSIYDDTVISMGRRSNTTVGDTSFAFGISVEAGGDYSHAEGYATSAGGRSSHAEGYVTSAKGEYSHAGGMYSKASGSHSYAEGYNTEANGEGSHAEGYQTVADGHYSHVEGQSSTTTGSSSHAEGYKAGAGGNYSHAEGRESKAIGAYSHTEGAFTESKGDCCHAEGYASIAVISTSHAEGMESTAGGEASHSEGAHTNASNYGSHASGKFNKDMVKGAYGSNQVGDVFVIGNGTASNAKSNALRVTYKGDVLTTKAYASSGADYAEFIKEWYDGNEKSEDRVGYFVTVKDGMLYKAEKDDFIYGITSGNPSVIGNGDEDYYWRYERDVFNRIVMEDVPKLAQKRDEKGNPLYDEETHEPVMEETGDIIPNARMKLNPNYDASKQNGYIPRSERKEWDYVGMVGVLPVRDDGTCLPDHLCRCGKGGTATFAPERGFDTYMVIERISDNIVSVLLK